MNQNNNLISAARFEHCVRLPTFLAPRGSCRAQKPSRANRQRKRGISCHYSHDSGYSPDTHRCQSSNHSTLTKLVALIGFFGKVRIYSHRKLPEFVAHVAIHDNSQCSHVARVATATEALACCSPTVRTSFAPASSCGNGTRQTKSTSVEVWHLSCSRDL